MTCQVNKKGKRKKYKSIFFIFSRAQTIRPDFLRTQQGIKKARSAIENCLSKTTGFNFMDMKAIIEDIVAEEEEAERLQRYGDNSLGVVFIRFLSTYSYIGNTVFPHIVSALE